MNTRLNDFVKANVFKNAEGDLNFIDCKHSFLLANDDYLTSLPIVERISIEGTRAEIEIEARLKLVTEVAEINLEATYKFVVTAINPYQKLTKVGRKPTFLLTDRDNLLRRNALLLCGQRTN